MAAPTPLFEALADPTRQHLVAALRTRERSVGDLVRLVRIRQPGVSRHLRILREAGFVRVRAVGQQRLYSLQDRPFRDLDDWVSGYRALWDRRLDRFASAAMTVRRPDPSGEGA